MKKLIIGISIFVILTFTLSAIALYSNTTQFTSSQLNIYVKNNLKAKNDPFGNNNAIEVLDNNQYLEVASGKTLQIQSPIEFGIAVPVKGQSASRLLICTATPGNAVGSVQINTEPLYNKSQNLAAAESYLNNRFHNKAQFHCTTQ